MADVLLAVGVIYKGLLSRKSTRTGPFEMGPYNIAISSVTHL